MGWNYDKYKYEQFSPKSDRDPKIMGVYSPFQQKDVSPMKQSKDTKKKASMSSKLLKYGWKGLKAAKKFTYWGLAEYAAEKALLESGIISIVPPTERVKGFTDKEREEFWEKVRKNKEKEKSQRESGEGDPINSGGVRPISTP